MAIRPSKIKDLDTKKKLSISEIDEEMKKDKLLEEEEVVLEAEKVYREGIISIKDLIAPTIFRVDPSYVQINQTYTRTLFVTTYPRFISIGWFIPILNFNAPLDISMFFYPIDSMVILKQLRNKTGALQAQISGLRDKGAARDPMLEQALEDVERLRDEITQDVERFFQYALYVTLYAETEKKLDELTEKIEGIFGTRLIYTRRALYQSEQGFNSTLPLGNDEIGVSFNLNSSPCAASFPFMSSELTSESGILYGINRHNNSLILFDRFSLQNANMVVFATSGAGKSYAVKLEVLRSLMMGINIIIIDPEMEYKHLCDAVGGTYINVSLSSENKINPFDLPRPLSKETAVTDIIRSAIITLKGLMRLMLGEITSQEDSIIDRALLETYNRKDITNESDLSKVEPPIMKDFQEILEGIVGAEDILLRLKKYTEGTFSGLLNNLTNIDTKNQLIVFSVRDLEDELRPIGIYLIINYIWNTVRSELKKRILIVDEAWWLMQHEDSAKFIYALVKRCRKYYLGVTTISQDVNDFLNSEYGQAIVTNSALQLLLKQSPAAIEAITKTFMLTQGEKYLLLDCEIGEGIFFAGAKHVAIKILASYLEDQLITSDPSQLLEIEEAKREFEESIGEEMN
ncbi:MAG: DUF87 domain-containing protein [Patescibacteria group bacterium]